jgi:hypothetical protein
MVKTAGGSLVALSHRQTSSRSIRRCFFAPAIYESDDRHVHCFSRKKIQKFSLPAAGGNYFPLPLPDCIAPPMIEGALKACI